MSKPKSVATFSIPWQQFLDEKSVLQAELPSEMSPDFLVSLYQTMCKTRWFDKKAIALQRTGKLGTYPSTLGQEAISVGVGAAMRPEDVLCPYYREYGAQLWRGLSMEEILLYWGGDERGSDFKNTPHDFPICVPIASQTLYGTGAALALKLKKEPRVAVAFIGDGGTSRGDFYEAMNVAGLWKLPIVFVINNNQWAISVPRDQQTGAQTLAQKAIAAGIDSIQIDGNDVIGVTEITRRAIERARAGNGPFVIEMMTYRMCDHTTADDASRYRSPESLTAHQKEDPILRLSRYLIAEGHWDTDKEKAYETQVHAEIQDSVERYLSLPAQTPEKMMSYLYETLPEAYLDQFEALQEKSNA